MIKAIIVDDEINAIESLRWELNNFCTDVTILDYFTNPIEAISAINYLKPDVVFLDIEMPELDGFQLLKKLQFKDFNLIITTAYNQYAIKGFKENAIDYLLKPIDPNELINAVEKSKKLKQRVPIDFDKSNIKKILENLISKNTLPKVHRVPLALSDRVVMVASNEIIYCKSDGNYTHVFLQDGTKYLLSKNIKSVSKIIDFPEFYRVHKSYLINIKHVKEYIRGDGGELIMINKINIPVSRINKTKILEALHIS